MKKKYRESKKPGYIDLGRPRKKIVLISLSGLLIFSFALLFLNNTNLKSWPLTGWAVSMHTDTAAYVSVNFSDEIGTIREDFYGVNDQMIHLSEYGKIDMDGDRILDTPSNYTWHRKLFEDSKICHVRIWIFLEDISPSEGVFSTVENSTWGYPAKNINIVKNEIEYIRSLGCRVLIRIDSMPIWLQNRTSGYCNEAKWQSCPPNDTTKFANMMADLYGNLSNDGEYSDSIDFEILNEPYNAAFCNNLSRDDLIKATEYIKLYAPTYNEIKLRYPSASVGGPTGQMVYGVNLTTTFLSNMLMNMSFVSIHSYATSSYLSDDDLIIDIRNLISNCSLYKANCSRIIISEWGINNGYSLSNETYGIETAYAYYSILNTYPNKVTLDLEEWSERINYTSPNFPNGLTRYQIVMEPNLDNIIYPPYNITKNFATYHSAGSMVVKSNSSASSIKVVASKKQKEQYITVINTGENSSVKLNISENLSSGLKDIETGEIYTIKSGIAEIGNISQYQIRYFVNYSISLPSEKNETPEVYEDGGESGGGDYSLRENSDTLINSSNETEETQMPEQANEITEPREEISQIQEENGTRTNSEKSGALTGRVVSEDEEKMPVFFKITLALLVLGIIFLAAVILYTIYWPRTP